MDHQAIRRVFKRAIVKGHFVLKSSLKHSDTYVEKANLCKDPLVFDDLCHEIALEVYSQGIEADVVVGPAPIGAIIANRVAYHLQELYRRTDKLRQVEFLFTEKDKEGQHLFRRSFCKDLAGKRVLLVDDILVEGRIITEFLRAIVQKNGTQIAGIAVMCNRGDLDSRFYGHPLISLLRLKLKSCPAEECLSCKAGIPIDEKY